MHVLLVNKVEATMSDPVSVTIESIAFSKATGKTTRS